MSQYDRPRRNGAPKKRPKKKKDPEFSKRLITDTRRLLWIVTVGGLVLAWLCIKEGFDASLPWLTAMVGLPWTAHGAICSFYLTMAKSDHREGGITFESAKVTNFGNNPQDYPVG